MNFNDKNRTINKERNNKVQRTNIIDGNVVKSIISKKEYYREQRKKKTCTKDAKNEAVARSRNQREVIEERFAVIKKKRCG